MGRVGWENSLQVSFLYLGFQPFSLSKSEGLGNKQNMLLNGEKKSFSVGISIPDLILSAVEFGI